MKKNYKNTLPIKEEIIRLPNQEILAKLLNYSKAFSKYYLQEIVSNSLKTSKLN